MTRLRELRDYIADPRQWPSNFEWEYVTPCQCAHGLAKALFPAIKWSVYDHQTNAEFFSITTSQSRYIFETPTELPYDEEETNEWLAVTPEEVVARMDSVLR